jgi:NAD(P)-dependent dehydrogenase (short-subunit alcohol dehydrogenase family)
MEVSKTVLITGCSSRGIGAAVALALANRNNHVFATARSISKIPESLTSLQNVTVLSLDVTSESSVASAVKTVESHGRGLDVLINNAAIGYTMPLLDIDLNHAHQVYETNVWGVLRVIQGFKDLLIKSHGKIVNVSSVGGAVHTPWIGKSIWFIRLQLGKTVRYECSLD